ncbi:hypothetical protein QNH20_14020 [Neobacillus sp. WH10]|uniref:hypothetical protein n=1 Tax=Neobacillus sp. WH10 TaxID=3047873 RepID=UPI0024C100F0|nr:hypothetical protein [Neobacillus sp. WH10]WHY75267.1 hypothetical protein QNH20_14020 [Neobacillus sp. WH10]
MIGGSSIESGMKYPSLKDGWSKFDSNGNLILTSNKKYEPSTMIYILIQLTSAIVDDQGRCVSLFPWSTNWQFSSIRTGLHHHIRSLMVV